MCICGAFQLDAAVPEKHLYIFFSLKPCFQSICSFFRVGAQMFWVLIP